MWPFKAVNHKYQAVAGDEGDPKEVIDSLAREKQKRTARRQALLFQAGVGILLLVLVVAGTLAIIAQRSSLPDNADISQALTGSEDSSSTLPTAHGCRRRREWRTLSDDDKREYITAVLCLRNQPSILAPSSNHSAYDDWPWVHSHVGYSTHHSASFLPWHRYFLHIYETTLRNKCGYDGGLVYWDWTLDFEAIENSPVFDPATGFGGDGEVGAEITVSNTGRCVVDGPFAGVIAEYYDVKYMPHCLSRGFRDLDGSLGHIDGSDISPASIEEVLGLDDYEKFVALMESRVHDVIPYGISGDFETFTAPYDPLFFLHHTQLDRLWWLWQKRQPGNGLTAYSGRKERHSMEMASMDDLIETQGLAEPVKVGDLMDIHGDLLCYDY